MSVLTFSWATGAVSPIVAMSVVCKDIRCQCVLNCCVRLERRDLMSIDRYFTVQDGCQGGTGGGYNMIIS